MSLAQTEGEKVGFAKYGTVFQRKVLQAMLMDHRWASQVVDVLDVTYFDLKHLAFLAERYYDYWKRFKAFPSVSILVTIIKDELRVGTDAQLREQIVQYLLDIKDNPDPGDLEYVKEKALDFCRKQAMKAAVEDMIEKMASENYDSCVEIVKKAVQVGTPISIGHDFQEEPESRFSEILRNPIPTGFSLLDSKKYLNGGLGAGELGVAVSPTGVGKSHFLVAMGGNAIKLGYDVVHYTFELSETITGIRYDSYLTKVPSGDVISRKDEVLEVESKMGLGRLIVKQYAPNTATVHTIRAHLEKLAMTKGIRPKLLIIDYVDNMVSSRRYEQPRLELKLLYEEVRGLGIDLAVPTWTASQSNKEGANAEIVDLTNMAEAYGKAAVADVMIGISRRSSEKATGNGRFFLAKNRFGIDGVMFPISIDTATSTFTLLGEAIPGQEVIERDQDELKKSLKQKWQSLQRDGLISPQTVMTSSPPESELTTVVDDVDDHKRYEDDYDGSSEVVLLPVT